MHIFKGLKDQLQEEFFNLREKHNSYFFDGVMIVVLGRFIGLGACAFLFIYG